MSATNTTTNLGLSQFINTDVPAWRGDYNGDMLKIDNAYTADISSATAETSADPSDYMKFYDVSASTNKKILVSDLLKGAKVEDLTDTDITSVANEDGLVYNSTSQKWENKQIVQKNQISNPNLLDNPWFTINQRGSASYTGGGYTVDRWLFGYGDITCSVVNSGITLSSTIEGSNYVQYIEEDYYNKFIAGKNVTLSALLADGTIKSKTAVAPINTSSYQDIGNIYLHSDCTLKMAGKTGENEQIQIRFTTANANPISIRAIKLELGTVSTLGLDAAPNYEEELLRCQRYYWRGHYAQYATVAEFDSGSSWTEIFIGVSAMRTTPVLTISGSIDYVATGGETPWVAFSDLTVREAAGEYVLGGNRGVSGSPTAGYCYSSDAGGTTIELSADL